MIEHIKLSLLDSIGIDSFFVLLSTQGNKEAYVKTNTIADDEICIGDGQLEYINIVLLNAGQHLTYTNSIPVNVIP